MTPWYVDIVNYLVNIYIPPEFNSQQRKMFFHITKSYFWDEPFLYKQYDDQLLKRCVDQPEARHILSACHEAPYGGTITAAKIRQSGYFGPSLFKDAHELVKSCDTYQRVINISMRQEMPLTNII